MFTHLTSGSDFSFLDPRAPVRAASALLSSVSFLSVCFVRAVRVVSCLRGRPCPCCCLRFSPSRFNEDLSSLSAFLWRYKLQYLFKFPYAMLQFLNADFVTACK